MMNLSENDKKRDTTLDWIKGTLIICVVLGHTTRTGICASSIEFLVQTVYGFHMPLFVFLCGYFFKFGNPWEMAKKTVTRLIVPYCVASVLFGVIEVLKGRSIYEVLLGVICGRAIGALWFLYAIAFVQLVCTLGAAVAAWRPCWTVPMCGGVVALALVSPIKCEPWILFYFTAGWLLSRHKGIFPRGFIGLGGVFAFVWFGHPWYTELGWRTIGLSLCTLMVLRSLAELTCWTKFGKGICFLGRHTMSIFVFHPLFLVIFRSLKTPILALDKTGVVFFILSAVFAITGCLLTDTVLRKIRLGWLFGLR